MSGAEIIIHLENKDERIPVQYNPPEYAMDWSAKYSTSQDKDGKKEFISEESGKMSFKLTIDGFSLAKTDLEENAADVSQEVGKLRKLMTIDEKLHRPPECTFIWGTAQFRGVTEKLGVRYTMFSAEGKPVRAVVDISITDTVKKKLALESPDRTKRYVLEQDTELFMVAAEAYNDPGAWRPIAAANGIRNPRGPETGIALRIPPLGEEI